MRQPRAQLSGEKNSVLTRRRRPDVRVQPPAIFTTDVRKAAIEAKMQTYDVSYSKMSSGVRVEFDMIRDKKGYRALTLVFVYIFATTIAKRLRYGIESYARACP